MARDKAERNGALKRAYTSPATGEELVAKRLMRFGAVVWAKSAVEHNGKVYPDGIFTPRIVTDFQFCTAAKEIIGLTCVSTRRLDEGADVRDPELVVELSAEDAERDGFGAGRRLILPRVELVPNKPGYFEHISHFLRADRVGPEYPNYTTSDRLGDIKKLLEREAAQRLSRGSAARASRGGGDSEIYRPDRNTPTIL